jgi:hypothetical protein
MIITARNKASSRTKNRLREHGPEFVLVEEAQPVRFDNGARLWVLVKNDTWIGWLPEEEIEIT